MIFHTNLTDHIVGVRYILNRIREFGLTIRPSKTYVAAKEVTFLGSLLKHGKIMPQPSLLDKIMAIQITKTKKQVRSLLGLINFYRAFLPNYSDIVSCLTELTAGTSANNHIKWSVQDGGTERNAEDSQLQTVPPYPRFV